MSVHMTAAEAESAKPLATRTAESSTGVRSLVVTIGPSLVLDGILGISTVLTLRGLQRRRKGHLPRLLRLIACVGAFAPWLCLLVVRRWVLHWGATEGEANEDLPGDEIVPKPVWQSTRAIDIAAPVHAVWPWLAQMGQNRGGLYSYDWLENVAGLDFHNADHLVPEWQEVKVGDRVRFAPEQDTLVVAQVEPDQCLVWRLLTPGTGEPGDLSSGSIAVDATWAFVLRGVDAEHTRLIQRFRFGVRPRVLGLLYPPLMEIPHFVMERGMLQGIRERAERAVRNGDRLYVARSSN